MIGAGRQNDLAAGLDGQGLALAEQFHRAGAATVKQHPLAMRSGYHGQVGAGQNRAEIGVRG